MSLRSLPTLLAFALMLAAPAQALLIDGFDDPGGGQQVLILPGGSNPASDDNATAGLGAVGGERDMLITRTAPGSTGLFAADANASIAGLYSHAQGPGVTGFSALTWDGADGDATSLDPLGLGGIDLTVGGAHDAISIILQTADQIGSIQLEVFTDGGNASSLSLGFAGPTTLTFEYASFAASLGLGADFANVGAIQLTVDGSTPDMDMSIDIVETVAAPEPGTLALLGTGLIGLALAGRRRR